MKWMEFKKRWCDCTKCELHKVRRHIVLARGEKPCDVLFIGEGPGASEDALGEPFVGPAGKLLDEFIEVVGLDEYRLMFTNLVCCAPKDDEGNIGTPQPKHIKACAPRLVEFVKYANPDYIVYVGDLAKKHGDKILSRIHHRFDTIKIIHPGAILRLDVSQKGLASQRNVVALGDLVDDLQGD